MYRFIVFAILFIGILPHSKAQKQQLLDDVSMALYYGDISDTALETLELFAEEVPEVYNFAQTTKNKGIDYNDSIYIATVTLVREYAEKSSSKDVMPYIRLLLLETQLKSISCSDFTKMSDDYEKILNVIATSDLDVAAKEKWRMFAEGIKLENVKFVQGPIQLTHHFNKVWDYLLSNQNDMSLEYLDLFCWIVSVLNRGDIQPLFGLPQLYTQARKIADCQMVKGSSLYNMELNYYSAMALWKPQGDDAMAAYHIKNLIENAKTEFGEISMAVANGYMAMSVIDFYQGYKSTALSYIEKANDIVTQIYDEDNAIRLTVEMNLACLYVLLEENLTGKGSDLYRNLYSVIETSHGISSDLYYELMFNAFDAFSILEAIPDAVEILDDMSNEILENISGVDFKDIQNLRIAILLRRCADSYKSLEKNDIATFLLEYSIDILSEMPECDLELAESLLYMGNLKSSNIQNEDAAESHFQAAEIYRINDYRNEAITCYSAAFDCYNGNKQMDNAASVMETIETYFPEAMNSYDYLTAKATLLIEEEPVKAIEYLNKMLELSVREGNEYMEAQSYSFLGLIYNSRYNDAEKALELYKKSLAIYLKAQEQSVINELTGVYSAMATIYLAMSDFGNAKKYIVECVSIYERNNGTKTAGYFNALISAANYFKNIGSIGEMMLYISKANIVGNELIGMTQDQVMGVAFCCRLIPLMVHIYRLCNSNPQIALGFNNSFAGGVDALRNGIKNMFEYVGTYFDEHNVRNEEYQTIQYHMVSYLALNGDYEAAGKELEELMPYVMKNTQAYDGLLDLRSDLNSALGNWDLVVTDLLTLCENYRNYNAIGYSNLLTRLSYAYLQLAEYDKVIDCVSERFELNRNIIDDKFHLFSTLERSAISGSTSITNPTDIYSILSFSRKHKVLKLVYDAAIYYKGVQLRTENHVRRSILSSNDSTLIADYNRMLDLRREYVLIFSKNDSISVLRQVKLMEEASVLDARIAERSIEYMNQRRVKDITWKNVKNGLADDEVAIEMIQYPLQRDDSITNFQYGALILRKNYKAPIFVPLLTSFELDSLRGMRSGTEEQRINNTYRRTVLATAPRNGDALYSGLWSPIEKHLSGVKKIYYSPIGALYTVAFAALEDSTGTVLCEKYDLRMVSNTAQVVNDDYRVGIENPETIAVIGGIIYDADTTKQSIRTRNWKELDNSFIEMRHLPLLARGYGLHVDSVAGLDATEQSIRDLSGRSADIIHISTHGFYRDYDLEQWKNIYPDTKPIALGAMQRSALVMADANPVWNGEERRIASEDGVLTAEEIAELDLSDTSLVLLGACETGLGVPDMNEGIDGLQRGFKLAGVQTVVMSLWSVNDKAESEFVPVFYEKLLATGNDRHQAFREAQLELKRRYPKNPFKWAYFVMLD